jgi:hypothetical protein
VGDPPAWGLGGGLITPPHRKTSNLLRIMIESLGPGWVLWPKVGTENWIRDLVHLEDRGVAGRMGFERTLGRLVGGGGCGVDSSGSG